MAASRGQTHRIGEFIFEDPSYLPSMRARYAPLHIPPENQGMRKSLRSGFSDELVEAYDSSPRFLFGLLCTAAVSGLLWAAIAWSIFILLA